MRAYEKRTWVQTTWILIRFWKVSRANIEFLILNLLKNSYSMFFHPTFLSFFTLSIFHSFHSSFTLSIRYSTFPSFIRSSIMHVLFPSLIHSFHSSFTLSIFHAPFLSFIHPLHPSFILYILDSSFSSFLRSPSSFGPVYPPFIYPVHSCLLPLLTITCLIHPFLPRLYTRKLRSLCLLPTGLWLCVQLFPPTFESYEWDLRSWVATCQPSTTLSVPCVPTGPSEIMY